MKKFKDANQSNNLSSENTMKKVIGFLDMLLINNIKTIDYFNGMTLKDKYIYLIKRMIFNRKYIIQCDTYYIFEDLLNLVIHDEIVLVDFSEYIKGLQWSYIKLMV